MISRTFGIECTRRCELVLALANIKSRPSLIAIAERLQSDGSQSALTLASLLDAMPEHQAKVLSLRTLERANLKLIGFYK